MRRHRVSSSAAILASGWVGLAAAYAAPTALDLEIMDLQAAPVEFVTVRSDRGTVLSPPSDPDGHTSLQIDPISVDAEWIKISLESPPTELSWVLLEPWNGWLATVGGPPGGRGSTLLLVARTPIEAKPIDVRISTWAASRILAEEALGSDHGGGERDNRVAVQATILGVPSETLRSSLDSLASIAETSFQVGIGSLWNGDYAEAATALLETWKRESASPSDNPPGAVDSGHFLGITYLLQGEAARAEFVLAEASELRPADPDILVLRGKALHHAGRFAEAESVLRRVLEQREAEEGPDPTGLTPLLNNLAILYFEQGRFDEARDLNERALTFEEAAEDPDHATIVALLSNLAAIHTATGDPAAAEPLLNQALEIEERAHGQAGEELAITLYNLAVVYFETGRLIDSKRLYERVLAIDLVHGGPDSAAVAADMSNLAMVNDRLGGTLEAERLYRRSLELREKILEPNHPDLAQSYANLAWFYHRRQRFVEAETLYRSALEVLEAAAGADPNQLAWTLKGLGMLHQKQGRCEEAEPLYRRSLEIYESMDTPDSSDLISLLWTYADLLEELNQHARAAELEERARNLRQSGKP